LLERMYDGDLPPGVFIQTDPEGDPVYGILDVMPSDMPV
jgi:hypothetical protein